VADSKKCGGQCVFFAAKCLSTLEIMGYIALIVLYAIILSGMNKIDKTMLRYANDNDCSDAVLNYATKQY
jgi:hypothetical protein